MLRVPEPRRCPLRPSGAEGVGVERGRGSTSHGPPPEHTEFTKTQVRQDYTNKKAHLVRMGFRVPQSGLSVAWALVSLLVLEGDLNLCPIGDNLSFDQMHVHVDHFGNAEVAQGFCSGFHCAGSCFLP